MMLIHGQDGNKKHQQDVYVDVTLPWPDVKVASKLCIGGPYQYTLKEGVPILIEWLLEHVVPHAVFDDDFKHMVSAGITRRIREEYDMLPRPSTMVENPVKKVLLVATGQEREVHLDEVPDFDGAGGGGNRRSRRLANQSCAGSVVGVEDSEHD
eukprot:6498833-Ditylum_brightwellii.AAC.1